MAEAGFIPGDVISAICGFGQVTCDPHTAASFEMTGGTRGSPGVRMGWAFLLSLCTLIIGPYDNVKNYFISLPPF